MRHLIDQLAHLAGQRDRDALDAAVVDLLDQLLSALSVASYRLLGDGVTRRWLLGHRRCAGSPCPPSAQDAADEQLPGWDDLPLLAQADCSGTLCTVETTPLSLGALPLFSRGRTVSVIELATRAPLNDEQRHLLLGVQRFYGHLRSLIDENERDALTQLLNRKSFDETFVRTAQHDTSLSGFAPLDAELPPSSDERREDPALRSSWLGVVDIDHFKQVNDRHGHLIGDEVLILLARLMETTFRQEDRLYRFGGEEFVVLVRSQDRHGAERAFERLRENVAAYDFPQVEHLTISVGCTEVRSGDTPTDAFSRADKAVYWAKAHGRNQVASYEALVAEYLIEAEVQGGAVEFF